VLQSFDNVWRLGWNVNCQPLILIAKKPLFHCFNPQLIVIVLAEALEEAKRHQKILNFEENFDALHPDGEKSQILTT